MIEITDPGRFFAFLIVVAIAFAIATGSVAKARGHDQTSWMTLGFFLGFLALFVVAVLPEGDVNRKRCPDCVSPVPLAANVCRHCGYRFANPS